VGLKQFDRKFGPDLVRELPEKPAVYLFKDESGGLLYAGKARNIRRRLQSYRNAKRRKAHRKMRTLVREASSLEIRLQPSERDALLLENELIRTHRPPCNVDGAYSFLYPAIGAGTCAHQTIFCFTTQVDAFADRELRWYGSFRSRTRTLDAFEALVDVLERVGHREPRTRLAAWPRIRGSRVVGFRRIEAQLPAVERLLSGESSDVLRNFALRLVEKPDARREAVLVGDRLRLLESFFCSDAQPLRAALRSAGRRGHFVPQEERDGLFILRRV
jgi:predicted GIY-YIG superfamily endonuclease